jgi:hypothetical protein
MSQSIQYRIHHKIGEQCAPEKRAKIIESAGMKKGKFSTFA